MPAPELIEDFGNGALRTGTTFNNFYILYDFEGIEVLLVVFPASGWQKTWPIQDLSRLIVVGVSSQQWGF